MFANRKSALIVLMALFVLATGMPGCASLSQEAPSRSDEPFPDDRVATVRLVMEAEDWAFCQTNAFDEEYVPADFCFDDELLPDIAVRTKGNSSLGQAVGWESPRLPLCVDFNFFNQARNFHGVKKVFLNNGWSDPTLIREVIAYEIFAKMDIPTPRSTIIDLWVNDTHLGVYTMTEMVDQAFLQRHFADASGNLYKPELIAARLDWTEEDATKKFGMPGTPEPPRHDPVLYTNLGGAPLIDILRALDSEETFAAYQPIPQPEGNMFMGLPPYRMPRDYLEAMMLKTNENNPDYSALFRFLDVLNNEPDETFPQEIEKVLDVDQTLRYIAVSALIVHLDNYIGIGHNNYLYEVNGKFTFIPWDTNMAFGTFNLGIRKDGLINYYIDEPTGGSVNRYPVVDRLLSYQPYMDKYRGYLEELLDGPFAIDTIIPRIDRLVEMIRPFAEADTEMFYSFEDWERCLTEDLRPPDVFEGWQAGGPSPMLPWMLHRKETTCLRENFHVNILFELMMRELTPDDLKTLESCLTEETYHLFLQNVFGPLEAPQPPRQPGFGPNSLGLKTFIIERHESVRQQLNGERPGSAGNGEGNKGSLWMVDWMNF